MDSEKEIGLFRFKQFEINQSNVAFRFGTDSVLLGSWADCEESMKVLDIGTGCGILPLMIAQRNSRARITGLEIDHESGLAAESNAYQSRFSDRISIKFGDFKIEDFGEDTFDLIISNPPFFESSLKGKNERRNRARHTDNLSLNQIFKRSGDLLQPKGVISLILPFQDLKSLQVMTSKEGLHIRRYCIVKPYRARKPNRVMLELSQNKTTPRKEEIIIYESRGKRSKEFASLTKDFYLST